MIFTQWYFSIYINKKKKKFKYINNYNYTNIYKFYDNNN